MSTYPPYIPPKDADFNNWVQNFDNLLTADPTLYGLTAPDAVAVAGVTATWVAAYAVAVDPATRTTPTIADKDNARASAEATIRPYAVQISRNASVTDENKAAIGVTVRSGTRTPIPPPTDAPTLGIVSATPLQTRLSYKVAGQDGKAKPFGSEGVQLFRSVGEVHATDPAQCVFNGTFTKSPFYQRFDAEDQGKAVTFFARYITRSGPEGEAQTGPWSAPLNLYVL